MSAWWLFPIGSTLLLLFGKGASEPSQPSGGGGSGGGDIGGGGQPGAQPAPGPAETAGCVAVVAARPAQYLGRTRPQGMSDRDWFGLVAYWQTYPQAPPDPAADDPVYGAALARLRVCVGTRLPGPQGPGGIAQPKGPQQPPPNPPAQLPTPAAKPTPGQRYRIVPGDTLSEVAAAAYGTQGAANLVRMEIINSAPYNQRFVRADAKDNFFPEGRISFNPRFGTYEQQAADPARAGEDLPGSNDYAVIEIPKEP